MLSDLRIAARALRKNPVFSATAVAVLALGIGANSAVFGLVNQALFSPEGLSQPDRRGRRPGAVPRSSACRASRSRAPTSATSGMRATSSSRRRLPRAATWSTSRAVSRGSCALRPCPASGSTCSAHVRCSAGRSSPRRTRKAGSAPSCSHTRRGCASSAPTLSIVGRPITGGRQAHEGGGRDARRIPVATRGRCVGSSRAAAGGVHRRLPVQRTPARCRPPSTRRHGRVGQHRVQQLAERVRGAGDRSAAFARLSQWSMFAAPLTQFVAGDLRTPMLVLLGAVSFVLLIACANIAGLMLARTASRQREIAVRAVLGAGRWQLARQTLAESALLSAAGAFLGLGFAWAGMRLMIVSAPEGSVVGLRPSLDPAVLLFTSAAGVVSALLFAVAPAWHVGRAAPVEHLKSGEHARPPAARDGSGCGLRWWWRRPRSPWSCCWRGPGRSRA